MLAHNACLALLCIVLTFGFGCLHHASSTLPAIRCTVIILKTETNYQGKQASTSSCHSIPTPGANHGTHSSPKTRQLAVRPYNHVRKVEQQCPRRTCEPQAVLHWNRQAGAPTAQELMRQNNGQRPKAATLPTPSTVSTKKGPTSHGGVEQPLMKGAHSAGHCGPCNQCIAHTIHLAACWRRV